MFVNMSAKQVLKENSHSTSIETPTVLYVLESGASTKHTSNFEYLCIMLGKGAYDTIQTDDEEYLICSQSEADRLHEHLEGLEVFSKNTFEAHQVERFRTKHLEDALRYLESEMMDIFSIEDLDFDAIDVLDWAQQNYNGLFDQLGLKADENGDFSEEDINFELWRQIVEEHYLDEFLCNAW